MNFKCPRCEHTITENKCPNCGKLGYLNWKGGRIGGLIKLGYQDHYLQCGKCDYYYGSKYCPKCRTIIYFEKCKVGGCFITTAVCDSLNNHDDCYELTVLRNYRDTWLLKQKQGKDLIDEYYSIAPIIVKSIEQLDNSKTIYTMIYEKYIKSCVALIENKKEIECMELYKSMVYNLKQDYCTI